MTAKTMTGRRPLRYGSRSTDGGEAVSIETLRRTLAARDRIARDEAGARRAAVLVPIVSTPAGFELLCFERTRDVLEHKGEICLPGGAVEPEDRDAVFAALREAREELGIVESTVDVVGLLDDVHTTVSNYIITPVAGLIEARPAIVADPLEVARPITVPLATLLSQGVEEHELRGADGRVRSIYAYHVGDDRIWGATARIIHGMLTLWFGKEDG